MPDARPIGGGRRIGLQSPVARQGTVPPVPVYRGGRGLRPGVNLDDSAALLDLMNDGDALR